MTKHEEKMRASKARRLARFEASHRSALAATTKFQTEMAKWWRELGEDVRASGLGAFAATASRAEGRRLVKEMREHAAELQRRAHEIETNIDETERVALSLS